MATTKVFISLFVCLFSFSLMPQHMEHKSYRVQIFWHKSSPQTGMAIKMHKTVDAGDFTERWDPHVQISSCQTSVTWSEKSLLWLRHCMYLVSHIPSASNLFSASASSPISLVPGMFWHSNTFQLDFVQPRNAWQSLILAFVCSPYSLWLSCVRSYCLENKSTEQNIYDTYETSKFMSCWTWGITR